MPVNFQSDSSWYALAFAALITIVGWLWKTWFGVRKDSLDLSRIQNQQSGYSSLIDELREEVRRLSTSLAELSEKLDDEVKLRRETERENHDLRVRIAHLESVVRSLGGTV